jgi:SAM-dependent methyltransferase
MGIPVLCSDADSQALDESALVDRMTRAYAHSSFEQLVAMRLSNSCLGEDRRQRYLAYAVSVTERGECTLRMFDAGLQRLGWTPVTNGIALDLGCGVGAGLAALAPRFSHVVGIDISLSALIAASKLVQGLGLRNVSLLQASALHLPFLNATFSLATAINVVEHVLSAPQMFAGVARVLVAQGAVCADSRNRFDFLFPEPHAGLRMLGFLPRRLMPPYVMWRTHLRYDHTRLLSYGELESALKAAFGREWAVVMPDVTAYGRSASLQRAIARLGRLPILGKLMIRLAPSHIALAHRTG